MKDITTVILAAGKGTRFKGKTSKIFQDLAGQPIINHIFDVAQSISGKKIIFVCNQQNINELKNSFKGCKFVIQKKPKGSADAIMSAKPFIKNKNFLIMFGDTPLITKTSISKLIKSFKNKKSYGSMIAFKSKNPHGYGRVVLKNKKVLKVVEEINTNLEEKKINLCNSGVMIVNSKFFFEKIKIIKENIIKKEKYLPDIFHIFFINNIPFNYIIAPEDEMLGVNTLEDFNLIDEIYQNLLYKKFIKKGVIIINPKTVRLSFDTKIDIGVIIESNVSLKNKVKILKGTKIKSNSYIEGVTIRENCLIGPSARIRSLSVIGKNVKIGNFVEIKNSYIGDFSSVAHLSYIGDSEIGKKVNIGAGTITCNFDGKTKHKTIIKDGAFIGSNSSLIAPLKINKNAKIAAGSVINREIPSKYLAIERSKLKIIKKN